MRTPSPLSRRRHGQRVLGMSTLQIHIVYALFVRVRVSAPSDRDRERVHSRFKVRTSACRATRGGVSDSNQLYRCCSWRQRRRVHSQMSRVRACARRAHLHVGYCAGGVCMHVHMHEMGPNMECVREWIINWRKCTYFACHSATRNVCSCVVCEIVWVVSTPAPFDRAHSSHMYAIYVVPKHSNT